MIAALAALALGPGVLAQESRLSVVESGSEIVVVSSPSLPAVPEPEAKAPEEAARSVSELADAYSLSFSQEAKLRLLERLSRTEPRTGEDVRRLLNLYTRDAAARGPAENSLLLLSPLAEELGPYFAGLIDDDDPFLQTFGMTGAFRLRYSPALPSIRRIAERKFEMKRASLSVFPGESNRWQAQFCALRILCAWEGAKVRPLLARKIQETPAAASLMAAFFWEESFDDLVAWSLSKDPGKGELAEAAWGASAPQAALRKTWPRLLAVVLDGKNPMGLRHPAAVKLGLGSGPEEAGRLLLEREKVLKDGKARVLLDLALFASHDPRAIPILEEYARKDPSPAGRAGALLQLRAMLPPEKFREVLAWSAANDPDEENRSFARREMAR